jgi:LPXTG-motif cell wall-anchored protein
MYRVGVIDDVLYVIGYGRPANNPNKYFSVNEQYIPFGYHGTLPSTGSSLNNVVAVVISFLMAGIIITGLFLYANRKKKCVKTL